MKQNYQRLNFSALPFYSKSKCLFTALLIFLFSASAVFSQELVFKNPVLYSGQAGANGAVYRFPNVTNNIDALLKIKKRSAENVVLQNIDVSNFGWGKALQPQLGINGNVSGIRDWWMEFELSFVNAGTNNAAPVNNFNLTVLDIDGDNLTTREYVELYKAKAYYLENPTNLTATRLNGENDDDDDNSGGKDYRFTGPVLNFLNIDTAGTSVMTTSVFENKSKISFKIGAKTLGLGTTNAAMRYNSLWFKSFNYAAATYLPVKLTSFTAKKVNDKVILNWATVQEKNSSHFTIERSFNGSDYTDAGIVFSNGESDVLQQYSFKDELRAANKTVIYYRLKMVDIDARATYSTVRIIRIGDEKEMAITTFPNPVKNKLCVTVPTTWQQKKIIIDVYNSAGLLVKKLLINSASQTELLNLEALQPGSYTVKVTDGNKSASQQIIKSKY